MTSCNRGVTEGCKAVPPQRLHKQLCNGENVGRRCCNGGGARMDILVMVMK